MLLFHGLEEAGYDLIEGLGISHHIQGINLNARNVFKNTKKDSSVRIYKIFRLIFQQIRSM